MTKYGNWAKALIFNDINNPDLKVRVIEYQEVSGF
jgi:hypothetical protein